ncbi:MAG: hypothetical protein H7066_16600 [Cytophagaceae bacterium]|nr:hypothetical protein [Gemmatimonadaceae bacterium]
MFPSLRRCVVLSAIVLLSTAPAFAQAREIQPGTRIRFTGTSVATSVTALVLERRGDTLKVLRGNSASAPFEVRLSELTTLQLSQGKSRAAGAGVGALWGAGINFFSTIIFIASGAECGDCRKDFDGPALAFSAVTGGVTGALVGVLIGKETWARVPLPVREPARPALGLDLAGLTHRRMGVVVTMPLRRN